MSKFEKNFLEQMLKMIKIFILAAYSADENTEQGDSVFDFIELVKQSSQPKEVVQNENPVSNKYLKLFHRQNKMKSKVMTIELQRNR
jgi:hypothetical protein